MKHIKPSSNKVKTIDCRKHDLVIRIADWTRDIDEPAYDVEVYVGGVYDTNESETFSTRKLGVNIGHASKAQAKAAAIDYAQEQIAKLL